MLMLAAFTARAWSSSTNRRASHPLPQPSMPLTATSTARSRGTDARTSRILSVTARTLVAGMTSLMQIPRRFKSEVQQGSTAWRSEWRGKGSGSRALVLLHHKVFGRDRLTIGAAQHGHRGSVLMRAATRRRRMVAIEFGTWRSGRSGGAAGSITVGMAGRGNILVERFAE